MLSRAAASLYWMSRYLERAENMARILDVSASMTLLDRHGGGAVPTAGALDGSPRARELAAPLHITGSFDAYRVRHSQLSAEAAARFLAWDVDLSSSIYRCFATARENARAVRSAITAEMWEAVNSTWLELQRWRDAGAVGAEFFDWVKERSHLVRGVTAGTILREQAYGFLRLGIFLERADNTARILDARYYQAAQGHGGDEQHEYYAWSALLRSVSALEAYRDIYHDAIEARRVAELLIFGATLPRSLRFCLDEMDDILQRLPAAPGRRVHRHAMQMQAQLRYGHIDEVLATGLHAYLGNFIHRSAELGRAVQGAFLETA